MTVVEIKTFQTLMVDMAFKLTISISNEIIQLKYFEICTESHILPVDSWVYALNFKLLIESRSYHSKQHKVFLPKICSFSANYVIIS